MHLAPRPLLLTSLLMLVGCGGPTNRAELTGTVRLNGEPLSTGSIAFFPAAGTQGPASGGTITDGKYYVPAEKGVAIGKSRVSILSTKKTGRQVDRGRGLEEEWVRLIPPKYNDSSEVICTIKPGSNRLDFDLQVDPKEWPAVRFSKTIEKQ
jgi:hypothetical protein